VAGEPKDSALEKTLKALLLINLDSMKQKQQIAILNKAAFGQSEIAEVVGSTPKAVSVRLAEAPAHKSTTMILIHTDAAAKLSASEGAVVALTVHEVPQGSARRSMP